MNIYLNFSSFFSNVQETPWYNDFLSPIVNLIKPKSDVLDIGTGTGKLLQLLANEKSSNCIGTDVNATMLEEAKTKLAGLPVSLIHVSAGSKLPFPTDFFDAICICSVLFNLNQKEQEFILNQSLELLDKNGSIFILNPTGIANLKAAFKIAKRKNNITFLLWNRLTRRRAWKWNSQGNIEAFCRERNLVYRKSIEFEGFAILETIQKQ